MAILSYDFNFFMTPLFNLFGSFLNFFEFWKIQRIEIALMESNLIYLIKNYCIIAAKITEKITYLS